MSTGTGRLEDCRVLIVDDDRNHAEGISDVLGETGNLLIARGTVIEEYRAGSGSRERDRLRSPKCCSARATMASCSTLPEAAMISDCGP